MKSHEEAAKEMDRKVIDAITCTMKNDYDSAISIISNVLETETYDDLRCEAFGYRAVFYEKTGRLDEALKDELQAYSLIVPSKPIGAVTFTSYVAELRIAGIHEKQSNYIEALKWYKKALKTISKGEGTSGGLALKSVIRMVGEDKLTDEERMLCNEVTMKSWKLMHSLGRLEGAPDLKNLLRAADEIIKAESKPIPRQ